MTDADVPQERTAPGRSQWPVVVFSVLSSALLSSFLTFLGAGVVAEYVSHRDSVDNRIRAVAESSNKVFDYITQFDERDCDTLFFGRAEYRKFVRDIIRVMVDAGEIVMIIPSMEKDRESYVSFLTGMMSTADILALSRENGDCENLEMHRESLSGQVWNSLDEYFTFAQAARQQQMSFFDILGNKFGFGRD